MIDGCIKKYGRRLYGLCMTLCANPAEADDLYQETWIRVLENIEKFDREREFEPWLTRICVNAYRNKLRRIKKNPVWDGFGSSEEKEAALNSAVAPQKEDYSALHEEIDRLPERLRLTVIVFYFRDLDIKETAKALKIPGGTVKSRLNKARGLLKEALVKYGTDILL